MFVGISPEVCMQPAVPTTVKAGLQWLGDAFPTVGQEFCKARAEGRFQTLHTVIVRFGLWIPTPMHSLGSLHILLIPATSSPHTVLSCRSSSCAAAKFTVKLLLILNSAKVSSMTITRITHEWPSHWHFLLSTTSLFATKGWFMIFSLL